MNDELTVLNPTADYYGERSGSLAPRPERLDGKVLGLLWNGKPGGDVALRTVGDMARSEIPGVEIRFCQGSLPSPESTLAELRKCDAVVACTADCGSCTSWTTHDCALLERDGVPTTIIVSAGFERDLEASARAFGVPGMRYVAVPSVYNNIPEERAVRQTELAVPEILKSLIDGSLEKNDGPAEPERADGEFVVDGATSQESLRAFNQIYLDNDWGDGYPLWPPTTERVQALAAGIARSPDELICLLPPGNGAATVWKVATNAAMAGCEAQDMEVVAAALRAIAKMRPVPRGALMSTSAHAPLFVVNGPIAREIGLNGGRCCIGPGRQNVVNLRIGRAILLCLKNIGRWYPGVMDLDTIGSLRKQVVVVAENEEESPWEPYHVSRGFRPTDSTVTAFFTGGEVGIGIQGHIDAQQLAEAIAAQSIGTMEIGYFSTLHGWDGVSDLGRLLFLSPPHAIPLQEGGFSKLALARFLHQRGREPVARLLEPSRKMYAAGRIKPEWEWLFHLSEQEARSMTLPVIETAENYSIVVVGAVRAKDLLMPTRTFPSAPEPIAARGAA